MAEAIAAAETVADPPKDGKKKKGFTFPSAFTILFAVTIVAVLATWIVPAGQYSKLMYMQEENVLQITSPTGEVSTVEATQETLDKMGVKINIEQFTGGAIKKPISIPGTYEKLEAKPVSPTQIPYAMVVGVIESIDVMVFILCLGGLIGVVTATGAFESGLAALTKKTVGREFLLVFGVSAFMIFGGTMCGLEEEAVAFYPILAPVFIALGYDSIVTVGAIFMAGSVGTTFSTVNPFSSVIASNAAGISFAEGIEVRLIGLLIASAVYLVYLWWYSKKVKANPEFSYTYEDREKFHALWKTEGDATVSHEFTVRKKLILIIFIAAFIIMIVGVMKLGWWFPQMAAEFITLSILAMFIGGTGKDGLGEARMVDAFSRGAAGMVAVALIIGLARGINYVLTQGLISDTMLYTLSNAVIGVSGPMFVIALLLIFFVLGFIVPSSSGLAVLSMPIFAPLADTVGIPRWIVVGAYQFGQYAMLYIAPTGLVMATLQMLDMKMSHWFKFVWPMCVFTLVFGAILLSICTIVFGM
ncbi:YfcC family protein [Eggerthellaceae bacterium zg-1084]|uniref:YfcC family protein n=1 Tax=Berryella wangjianweii TaxID=2734634 RepID=A0A6M8J6H2_9ACTN|nr:YfcC family protein [Berryella wangjianweii]NPD30338.1 YfcC family protein [Berryella wangjianweii]QKF07019.1 YfcC family protein [Berryella wangjianweii]